MTACWHHYVPDVDGENYCDRCGDCPGERAREAEAENEEEVWPIGYIVSS